MDLKLLRLFGVLCLLYFFGSHHGLSSRMFSTSSSSSSSQTSPFTYDVYTSHPGASSSKDVPESEFSSVVVPEVPLSIPPVSLNNSVKITSWADASIPEIPFGLDQNEVLLGLDNSVKTSWADASIPEIPSGLDQNEVLLGLDQKEDQDDFDNRSDNTSDTWNSLYRQIQSQMDGMLEEQQQSYERPKHCRKYLKSYKKWMKGEIAKPSCKYGANCMYCHDVIPEYMRHQNDLLSEGLNRHNKEMRFCKKWEISKDDIYQIIEEENLFVKDKEGPLRKYPLSVLMTKIGKKVILNAILKRYPEKAFLGRS